MLIDFLFVGAPALRELASLGGERGRQQRQMKVKGPGIEGWESWDPASGIFSC